MSVHNSVVHLLKAPVGFFLGVETQIAKAAGLASFLVKHDLCLGDFIVLAREKFIKVKVVKVLCREVCHVDTGRVHYILISWPPLLILAAIIQVL